MRRSDLARVRAVRSDETAFLVEHDGIVCHVREDSRAPVPRGKRLGEREHRAAVPTPLRVEPNRDAPEDRIVASNVDSNDTDWRSTYEQQLCVIARRPLVRAILVIDTEEPSRLEEHLAPDRVVDAPRFGIRG